MKLYRHWAFLKMVLLHSITAFGGPQGHYGMMLRRFVVIRKDITEEELLDLTAFCQLLPGASSTQTLMLIGYKRGGVPLALLTLLIWILPAVFLMSSFSFLMVYFSARAFDINIFKFIHPMALGFLAFATVRVSRVSIKSKLTALVALVSTVFTFLFFKNPIIFPILIVAGGIVTNFQKRPAFQIDVKKHKVQWLNISLFVGIFMVLAFMSGASREKQIRLGNPEPEYRIWNLSENFYRFGSIVFGGGDVLLPFMYEQFVVKPTQRRVPEPPYMSSVGFLTGSGMVRAIPGPVFSVAAFHGGMAMSNWGGKWQLLGCISGVVFIFLPSALLALFFFPVWNLLKKYPVINRAVFGINAVVVGIMCASFVYLLKDIAVLDIGGESGINVLVIAITYLLIQYTKLPSPFIVGFCLFLGCIL